MCLCLCLCLCLYICNCICVCVCFCVCVCIYAGSLRLECQLQLICWKILSDIYSLDAVKFCHQRAPSVPSVRPSVPLPRRSHARDRLIRPAAARSRLLGKTWIHPARTRTSKNLQLKRIRSCLKRN